ncbi:MAG: glycosyl transferase [Clostridia bacterium]|nr:glycosyl transferase [Clostridia bacterium]
MFEKIQLYMIYLLGRFIKGDVEKDKKYLKILYKFIMKKECDFDSPKTYNEKLQYLKLYNRNPLYTKLVDKFEVKEYVKKIIGEEYIIPTLGVWDSFDEINFEELPEQFVLKCTHDSGGLVIVTDKSKFDKKKAKRKIEHCLKRNYFYNNREWPYKDIKPRIIAEKYMVDESGYELKDYKFFCFDGKAKSMFIATDRSADTETCFDFYDMDFNHLPFTNGHPNATKLINKPDKFEEMIKISELLSKDLIHARVDLYNINGKIYFGEITFFHWSGLVPFVPEEWDYKFGEWIQLPKEK